MCYHAIQLSKGSTHHHLLVVHVEMLSKCCHIGQTLPTCCTHQDTHAIKILPHCHYLLVVHIKINRSHSVKMLPQWTVITYLLCTSRYAKSCSQNAATSDSHYLLVIQVKIHKITLSKDCHIGQSFPTCTHKDTYTVKMLPHWTVITYLLYRSRYTKSCCQKAATLDSHYLLVVHIKIHMLSKGCHIGQSLPTCCTD